MRITPSDMLRLFFQSVQSVRRSCTPLAGATPFAVASFEMIVTLTYDETTRPFEIELGDGVAYEPILRYAAAYRLKLWRARPPRTDALCIVAT